MKLVILIALLAAALAQAPASDVPLTLKQSIDLPAVEGRIDHLAIDVAHRQLFVAALGNNTVEVVDLAKGARARSLPGFHEPQGIAVAPDLDLFAVANGESGDLVIAALADAAVKGTVRLSDDADNVRYDARAKRFLAAHGSGAISVIDPVARKVVGSVSLPGHPESFRLEQRGTRLYANVPAADAVAAIDRQTMKVDAQWTLIGARANYPLALDEEGHRLFVGCRHPAKIVILDTSSGRQSGAIDICGDTDDLFYDAARKRLYVSCGKVLLTCSSRTRIASPASRTSRRPQVHGHRSMCRRRAGCIWPFLTAGRRRRRFVYTRRGTESVLALKCRGGPAIGNAPDAPVGGFSIPGDIRPYPLVRTRAAKCEDFVVPLAGPVRLVRALPRSF
jgi:DNA-binding beta-propeller fold protein YncE